VGLRGASPAGAGNRCCRGHQGIAACLVQCYVALRPAARTWPKQASGGQGQSMPPRRFLESPSCRCVALNKAGRQCGIISTSQALDSSGRLAATPLLHGGTRCIFHARWLCSGPLATGVLESPPLVVYIDLETTGLSLAADEIVEIGMMAEGSKAAFSTVVRPMMLPGDCGVHGISPSELLEGPTFPEAFDRVATFLDGLAASALSEGSSSSDESGPATPRLRSSPPRILLAAHNGFRFDYPMIVSQLWRSNLWPGTVLGGWLYVDTLDVLKAADASGACLKLQCQRISRGVRVEAAHRALDDCRALASVMQDLAESLGLQPRELLARFAWKLDMAATAAELPHLL